jgi:hypothetical protein
MVRAARLLVLVLCRSFCSAVSHQVLASHASQGGIGVLLAHICGLSSPAIFELFTSLTLGFKGLLIV